MIARIHTSMNQLLFNQQHIYNSRREWMAFFNHQDEEEELKENCFRKYNKVFN